MPKVLFVCLGNICRSPTAEGVFEALVEQSGAQGFEIDSAGTGDWHVGNRADPRMQKAANARGYTLRSRARQVCAEDFDRFDYIVAMDRSNERDLRDLCTEAQAQKISLLRSHSGDQELDVPDPYYGGAQGFDQVVQIVEHSCSALLDQLKE